MLLPLCYLGGVVVVAVGVFVAGSVARRRYRRGPSRLAITAGVAGAVWPLFLAGVTQFVLLFVISRIFRFFFGIPTSCVPAGGVNRSAPAATEPPGVGLA